MLWMFYGMVGEGMGGKESGRGGEGKLMIQVNSL